MKVTIRLIMCYLLLSSLILLTGCSNKTPGDSGASTISENLNTNSSEFSITISSASSDSSLTQSSETSSNQIHIKENNSDLSDDTISKINSQKQTSSSTELFQEKIVSEITTSSYPKKVTDSSNPKEDVSSVPVTVIETPKTDNSITTFEEGKKKLQETVEAYQKEHNIDPSTAGETGEICHCGKKVWNPDKYGFANPGYPNDYENSGYCTGACAIVIG